MKKIINNELNIPLYIQIKKDIIRKIISKEFKVGESIPGENQLKDSYKVSLITIRKAISELVNEGYLYRIQGRGTYPINRMINRPLNLMSFTEDMREKNFRVESKLLELDKIKDEYIAAKIGIPISESLIKIKRIRIVDNEPIALQTSYIPKNILSIENAKRLEKENSLYEILKELGVEPYRAHEKYCVSLINDEETSKLLHAAIGSPLFSAERVTFTKDNLLFEYAEFLLRGDKYTVEIELKK